MEVQEEWWDKFKKNGGHEVLFRVTKNICVVARDGLEHYKFVKVVIWRGSPEVAQKEGQMNSK